MYGSSYMFQYYIAIFMEHSWCLLSDVQLRSSRWNIVEWRVVFSDGVRTDLRTPRTTTHNTTLHNIISPAPQLSISQKALEKFPKDGM
jgi:hypothetical protein